MWLFLIIGFRDSNVVIRNLSFFNLSSTLTFAFTCFGFILLGGVCIFFFLKAGNPREQNTTLSSSSGPWLSNHCVWGRHFDWPALDTLTSLSGKQGHLIDSPIRIRKEEGRFQRQVNEGQIFFLKEERKSIVLHFSITYSSC